MGVAFASVFLFAGWGVRRLGFCCWAACPWCRCARSAQPKRARLAQVLFDGLDTVLTLTSMFYLQCYAITNLACFLLRVAAPPNFRPTFRHFSKRSAMMGFVTCLGAMTAIDAQAATISWGLSVSLFIWIHSTTAPHHWGEVTQALLYHQTRELLLRLDASRRHVRNWRPQVRGL
jgi:potassium/chloride transporter 9